MIPFSEFQVARDGDDALAAGQDPIQWGLFAGLHGDEPAAREAVIDDCFHGIFSVPPEQDPRPFNLIFETPARVAIFTSAATWPSTPSCPATAV